MRKLTFRALALRRSESGSVAIHSDEGLTLETSASESLYGGQFTLSTQLIKPNYLVILPPTQHHSFFRNLPPYFFRLILAGKNSTRKQYTSFLLVALKCCCLRGKLEKHIRGSSSYLFLFTRSTKFPPFFSNLEPGA